MRTAADIYNPGSSRWTRIKGQTPAWVVSLAVHLLILAFLATLTWVVVRPEPPELLLVLSDGDAVTGAAAGGNADADNPMGLAEGRPSESASVAAAARAIAPPAPPQATALDAAVRAQLESAHASPDGFDGEPTGALMRALGDSPSMFGGGFAGAGLDGVSAGFGEQIEGMRRRGLDVVFVFDATGSMSRPLDEAKRRIAEVIDVIVYLAPNARFGAVAFKDYDDEGFGVGAIRTCAITDDHESVRSFLGKIRAGGGGDRPEPIHEALTAAVHPTRLGWRKGATRVIVLIGDAPVHPDGRADALAAARRFHAQLGGRISAIDVKSRGGSIEPDLAEIASRGGGEAFPLAAGDEFWRHLIVSVFGEQYKNDVETIIDRVMTGE